MIGGLFYSVACCCFGVGGVLVSADSRSGYNCIVQVMSLLYVHSGFESLG